MGSGRTNKEIALYTAKVISGLEEHLQHLTRQGDPDDKRADKIDQWIESWTGYLKREKQFNPRRIPPLQRGSVVYVNFGFNVGMEYGGFHYAIVLNKVDSSRNHLLHLLPLTSVKENTNLKKLKYFQYSLGNDIHNLLITKANNLVENLEKRNNEIKTQIQKATEEREEVIRQVEAIQAMEYTEGLSTILDFLKNKLQDIVKELKKQEDEAEISKTDLDFIKSLVEKIQRMKTGSIALLNQVTTISKMRLVDPIQEKSFLKDIILPAQTMDEIDKALNKIF